ncbi:TPA: hypothetical protein L9G83_005535 [Klebsiella pneumoniae]|uniref:hypothetical protein n=1 Tax=Klebsiella pneumoniae TaxID=573 RepID=UPI000D5978CC|nr:hypothetical protein [Klebsiella pneumoniae]HBR0090266.1 hypothetical protein [Klebsiella pneumoniae]HBR0180189.1 hypothetical protein [Klebsiella pneumoniae]HBR0185426.1 hypothetical protein [Klebsiella pneumoniae]HBR0191661.1 hypothetical protein [Klebsiella pneumoniae]HBR0224261.1 hypothetical protein [Klebsiella pneumoniae]
MTITETQKTAQLAADAAVSAAEAKQYMLEAEQGYQDTSAAAQQAQDAAGSALLSKQSAATSEENSLQYATEAGVARDEAVTAASNASDYAQNKFTFYKTASDPDGTIAGLAATTDGQSFWVAQGPDALSAAWQYQNKAGVAVLQAKQPGTSAITGTIREFPTLAAAQADADAGNIPVGSTAYYRSSDDSALAVEVINNAGTLQPTGRKMPSQGEIDALNALISNDPSLSPFVQWEGDGGFILAQLAKDYLKTAGFEVGAARLSMRSLTIDEVSDKTIIVQDENGFVLEKYAQNTFQNISGKFIPTNDNNYVMEDENGFKFFSPLSPVASGGTSNSNADRMSFIASMDNDALGYSLAINNKLVTGIQRPVFDYNLVVTYGQSLSTGTEGWPALSKVAIEVNNVLMFGNSVRPNTDRATGGSTWNPLGGAALNPLIAVTQSIGGASVLTDAEVSALAPGAVNEGETVDVGAVNFWRQLQNDFHGVSVDPARKIIVLNCGVQGRTVEELSKGHAYNHYNRVIEAVTKVKAYIASQQPTATVGITAFLYMQGEWNYWTSTTGTHDRATFLDLTKQLRTDLITDCAYGICGQKLPPAWVTYQTGGSYTDDTYNLAIGMAQIDMADQVPGCWLATPVYQVTDKNGHLDPNGYRWAGMQFGKVLHRILDRGTDWKPLKPIKVVRYSDDEIMVSFNTPSPPLQFKEAYVVNTPTMYPNKGFLVKDANGAVGIASVSIVGQSTVSIKLSAPTTGDVYLWYAPKTTYNGNGNLCDSDSSIAPYNYEYHAGSGQYASANISALVDKPYPLNNWCCAFRIKVEDK